MYFEELIIIIVFVVGIYLYRNYKGENVGMHVLQFHLFHMLLT